MAKKKTDENEESEVAPHSEDALEALVKEQEASQKAYAEAEQKAHDERVFGTEPE